MWLGADMLPEFLHDCAPQLGFLAMPVDGSINPGKGYVHPATDQRFQSATPIIVFPFYNATLTDAGHKAIYSTEHATGNTPAPGLMFPRRVFTVSKLMR